VLAVVWTVVIAVFFPQRFAEVATHADALETEKAPEQPGAVQAD